MSTKKYPLSFFIPKTKKEVMYYGKVKILKLHNQKNNNSI